MSASRAGGRRPSPRRSARAGWRALPDSPVEFVDLLLLAGELADAVDEGALHLLVRHLDLVLLADLGQHQAEDGRAPLGDLLVVGLGGLLRGALVRRSCGPNAADPASPGSRHSGIPARPWSAAARRHAARRAWSSNWRLILVRVAVPSWLCICSRTSCRAASRAIRGRTSSPIRRRLVAATSAWTSLRR